MHMHSGIDLLEDVPGTGPLVQRQRFYRIRIRMWLNKGEPVRWQSPWGSIKEAVLEDEGRTLVTDVRLDRVFLINFVRWVRRSRAFSCRRPARLIIHNPGGVAGLASVSGRVRSLVHR